MKAYVHVYLKRAVLDPQGKAIAHALHELGYKDVKAARQGKMIELDIADGLNKEQAEESIRKMCEDLLANTVIEDYSITLEAA